MSLEIRAAEPTMLKLSEIVLDAEILLRSLDEETAASYAEVLKAKRELPPILVYRIGDQYFCCDGQHRVRAHVLAKRDKIACTVVEGTRADCLLASAGANAEHGKPRTTEHKTAAVLALRRQPEWAEASARWLAERCNVSPNFVIGVLKTVHGEQLTASKGKDGKVRKAPKRPKRKPFDAAKQVKLMARALDQLAKKWPADVSAKALTELLFTHATEFEKRNPSPAAAE